MSSIAPSTGTVRRLWLRWKALPLPWRKERLCGSDLAGNTFWEFQDAINIGRRRRIVKYPGKVHHDDVVIPPPWIQWLRHTRRDPPTIEEQQADVVRQQRMRVLAAEADARWAAKPSFLVAPEGAGRQQIQSGGHEVADNAGGLEDMARKVLPKKANSPTPEVRVQQNESNMSTTARPVRTSGFSENEPGQSPWDQAAKAKDEPDAWSPTTIKRR